MSTIKYRPDIDGLRAFAIISVLIYHTYPSALPGGFVGVDIFFVISGFLISSLLFQEQDQGSINILSFYQRRVKRIFPALSIVLISTYVFGWLSLMPDEFKDVGKHIAAGSSFTSNIALWSEAGYFDTRAHTKPLLHLWSLGVEEQFYIFLPLLLILIPSAPKYRFLYISTCMATSFIACIIFSTADPAANFYWPITRFWELLIGVMASLAHVAVSGKKTSNIKSAIGCTLIIYAVFATDEHRPFPGYAALAPTLGTALVIMANPSAQINKIVLASRWMIWVGLISFPLYLWHWPIIAYLRIITPENFASLRPWAIALSIFLAWLTYRYVEIPFRKKPITLKQSLFLIILMATIGLIGYNAHIRHGLRFRVASSQIEPEWFAWPSSYENAIACRKKISNNELDYCNDNNEKSILTPGTTLIVGDSHANHFFPGLADKYTKAGKEILLLGKGGCAPIFDLEIYQNGSPQKCKSAINQALTIAENNNAVSTVVLSARWPLYINGTEFGINDTNKKRQLSPDNSKTPDDQFDIFLESLAITIKRLQAAHKRVAIISTTPEMGFNPKYCFGEIKGLVFQRRAKSTCAIERSAFIDRNNRTQTALEKIKSRYPSILIIEPSEAICKEHLCWAESDGKPLYRDEDHLSFFGSQLLAEKIFYSLEAARSTQ